MLICNSKRDEKDEKALSTGIVFENRAWEYDDVSVFWNGYCGTRLVKKTSIVLYLPTRSECPRMRIRGAEEKVKLTSVQAKKKGTEVVRVFWLPLTSNDSKRKRKNESRIY